MSANDWSWCNAFFDLEDDIRDVVQMSRLTVDASFEANTGRDPKRDVAFFLARKNYDMTTALEKKFDKLLKRASKSSKRNIPIAHGKPALSLVPTT